MDRISIIALQVPNNKNMHQPSLEEMMDMCNIAMQESVEEKNLIAEFDAIRTAYLAEIHDVRSRYQSKFDSILSQISDLRNKSSIGE